NLFLNTPTAAHGVPKSTPQQSGHGSQEQAGRGTHAPSGRGAQANQVTEVSSDPLEIRLPAPTPYEANLQGQWRARKAWTNFHARHPEWNVLFDQHTGQPHRLFGPALAMTGNNPVLDFVRQECQDFGMPVDELREGSTYASRKSRYQWYEQWHQGLQVIGGRLGLKRTPEGALVW
ncbi:MAG: hypothetical protein ACKO9W_08345, partial [Bacteroidota bacterium]